MTTNQLAHHAEQMEAARQEFSELWNRKFEPRIRNMTNMPPDTSLPLNRENMRLMLAAHDIAWQVFIYARQPCGKYG